MKLRVPITILLLITCISVSAQICLKGKVLSVKDNTAVSFASVLMKNMEDTVSYKSLTDLNGEYVMQNLRKGKYLQKVSCLGYLSEDTVINVSETSGNGNTITEVLYMKEEANTLDEVTVVGSNILHSIDQHRYLIDKVDLRNATNSTDLIRKIPGFEFDIMNNKIKSLKSGSIKILINGVSATETDLIAIDANQIKEIVHYDFPPARYAGYSSVLNFITKRRINGFNAGLDAQHAFTTGFANDVIYANYNHGYNQFSVEGQSNYRNYKHFDVFSSYCYKIGNNEYNSVSNAKRKFGYDDNYISLKYNRNVPEKYQFNIAFSPNFQHVHLDEDQSNIFCINNQRQDRTGTIYNRSHQFTPSLDAYLDINLKHNQELTLNVVGTLISAKQDYIKHETHKEETVYEDFNYQKNNKHSIISEIVYQNKINSNFMLSVGEKFSYSNLSADIDNSFGNNTYKTKMYNNYNYIELKGNIKKIMFRGSLGINYYNHNNFETSYKSWIFSPMFLIGSQITDRFMVRGMFERKNASPNLSQLSNNKTYIDENIISCGNPELKNSVLNTVDLTASYNLPWLTTEFVLEYCYNKLPINTYFVEENNSIMRKYENAKSEKQYLAFLAFTFNPFPKSNIIKLRIATIFERDCINSELVGRFSHNYVPLGYDLVFNYKKWILSYSGHIVAWKLSAPYLSTGERVSNLCLRYSINKNLCVKGDVSFFCVPAKYETKTIDKSIVQYQGYTNIHDNHNMFTLGLSYRFNCGKSYNEKGKILNNSDSDSGIN